MAARSDDIRTVALVGHGDTGKTTFAEHALLAAGVIKRAGTVAAGTTVMDYDPDERERGHSIDTAIASLTWGDKTIQIVDCPGYPDFAGTAIYGMSAAETSIVFANAAVGIGVNGRRMWAAATKLGRARIVVINKCDHDNADPARLLTRVQTAFGPQCVAYNLPVGSGGSFKSVVSCWGEGDDVETSAGDLAEAREAFVEAVVETDDDLLMEYLDGGVDALDADAVQAAFHAAVRDGSITPVCFAAGEKDIGVTELLDLVRDVAPTGAEPQGVEAKNEASYIVQLAPDGPFLSTVVKVASDVHVGKLVYLRAWSGMLPSDGACFNSRTKSAVKLQHPKLPMGKDLTETKRVRAGQIFCVSKVEELTLGSTVSDMATKGYVTRPGFREPMVHLAVEPVKRGDEQKIMQALQKLADEDPGFRVERTRDTNELVMSGRSSLQLDIAKKRLHSRYHVDIKTHLPTVPLKETIQAAADGHHRHKKQSGGRGQFGEVYLRVRPAERGSGLEFENKTVGGSIPHNFIPAVEKGIREQMEKGVLAGHRFVDVHVEVYDGKHHPVDSSEAAFKLAGARAFRDAVMKAKPALLEPIMAVSIEVPIEHMGDITSDLNTRRGRIQGMDAHDDLQVINAQVPLSELQTYSTDLRSMTSGEGMYTVEFDHLDVVPAQIAKRLVDAFQSDLGDDD